MTVDVTRRGRQRDAFDLVMPREKREERVFQRHITKFNKYDDYMQVVAYSAPLAFEGKYVSSDIRSEIYL